MRDPGDADRDGRGRRVGDDVEERWGLGAERDIRRVRRWRGHDGRDAIGATAGGWRERLKMGVPGGERLEAWAGYPGGSHRAGRSG